MSRLNRLRSRIPVTVTPPSGSGAWGSGSGAPVQLVAGFRGGRHLVRDRDGVEVFAEATLVVPPQPDVSADLEDLFRPGALVDVRGHPHEVVAATPALRYGRFMFLRVSIT